MKFTIIIPCYNSSEFIKIPLNSLEKQIFDSSKFEVLIIDDGSNDNLKNVIKDYLIRNKNWKYIKKENGNWGSVINFVKNKGLAKGKYITILDSDDYFLEETLTEINKIDSDVIVSKIYRKIKNKEKVVPVLLKKTGFVKKYRAMTPISTPHGKFYKTSLFNKMPNLEEGISYQDTVLYAWMVGNSKNIYYINKPLAVWWFDRTGNSTSQVWDKTRANLWIDTCNRVLNVSGKIDEVYSWAIMYLWELKRKYKKKDIIPVKIDKSKVKFKWLFFGIRTIGKIWFLFSTRNYWIDKRK